MAVFGLVPFEGFDALLKKIDQPFEGFDALAVRESIAMMACLSPSRKS
jgi:hypothetical protein